MCRAIGSNPARKCWRDLIRTYFLRRGSIPQWVKTPVSKGSLRPSDTTICMAPVSSTAVRPMRTRVPVAIGPVTVNCPSVMRVTLPVTASGLPSRLIWGMSTRPPSGRVTPAAVPASTSRRTPAGSQMGPATTSVSPWRITSSITLITSWVPPDAVLSP